MEEKNKLFGQLYKGLYPLRTILIGDIKGLLYIFVPKNREKETREEERRKWIEKKDKSIHDDAKVSRKKSFF